MSDAMSFCQKMTDKDIKEKKLPEGYYYTLPTGGRVGKHYEWCVAWMTP